MPLQRMTRHDLHEDYMANPGVYKAMAKEHKMSLPVLFNRISPKRLVDDAYEDDAFSDILYREDLVVNGSHLEGSSDVEQWLDTTDKEVGPKEELFWAQLDRDYDASTSLPEFEMRRKAAATTTVGQITENTPLNPRQWRALYERNPIQADIGIADIATSMETINTRNFGQPEYTTPDGDHHSAVVGEAMPLPVTTLTTGDRTGKMKKIGAGLRVSREYEMDQTRMGSIRRWVSKVAISDEIYIVHEGINFLFDSATGATLGAPSYDSILDLQMHYVGTNRPYRLDTLIAKKDEAQRWIKASQLVGAVTATTDNTFQRPVPPGRFDGIYTPIRLGNGRQGPEVIYAMSNTTTDDPHLGTKLAANRMLAIDSRFALVFYQLAAGMLSEEKYDPRTQVRERFLSRWFGWFVEDPDAVINFDIS